MAHFEVWITIVLSLGMSLVRVEPKNILPYVLGFEVFSRIFSVDSFRSKFGAKAKSWALHSVLHLRVAHSKLRNELARTSAAEIRGGFFSKLPND